VNTCTLSAPRNTRTLLGIKEGQYNSVDYCSTHGRTLVAVAHKNAKHGLAKVCRLHVPAQRRHLRPPVIRLSLSLSPEGVLASRSHRRHGAGLGKYSALCRRTHKPARLHTMLSGEGGRRAMRLRTGPIECRSRPPPAAAAATATRAWPPTKWRAQRASAGCAATGRFRRAVQSLRCRVLPAFMTVSGSARKAKHPRRTCDSASRTANRPASRVVSSGCCIRRAAPNNRRKLCTHAR
jgi:hypothetical protein